MRAWSGNIPVVIVPTAYPEDDEARIRAASARIANRPSTQPCIRASVTPCRMSRPGHLPIAVSTIRQGHSSSVEESFRLQRWPGGKPMIESVPGVTACTFLGCTRPTDKKPAQAARSAGASDDQPLRQRVQNNGRRVGVEDDDTPWRQRIRTRRRSAFSAGPRQSDAPPV